MRGLDDSRCIENWVYKERMEEYSLFFQNRVLNVVASRKALENVLVGFGVSSSFTVWGPKIPPVLLTATQLIRA